MVTNICAIIVTYNRKELLSENILKTISQKQKLDSIFVIDNHGDDKTKDYLDLKFPGNQAIKYFYLPNNVGGAGGFEFGLKRAFESGFDWFILMDDDGRPLNDDTFSKLTSYIERKKYSSKELVLLNSLVTTDGEFLSFTLLGRDRLSSLKGDGVINEDKAIIGTINPFNGTLISRGLVAKIGYPNGAFFIRGDETDYYWRAKKAGAYVITISDSLYFHPRACKYKVIKIFGYQKKLFIDAPLKEYYNMRNYVYSVLTNFGDNRKTRKQIKKSRLFRILSALLLKCPKRETIRMIKIGYSDGKNGKLGKFQS